MRKLCIFIFIPLLIRTDPYSFPWSAGDIRFTCDNLGEGWIQAGSSCFYSWSGSLLSWKDAQDFCNSSFLHFSSSILVDNWLLARSLQAKIPQQPYWTGFTTTTNETTLWRFPESLETSIYNPLWADDQPPARSSSLSCLALDMSPKDDTGWRVYDCDTHLPVLCQTFACLPNEYRCLDNSRCVPSSAVGDGIADCEDFSDERKKAVLAYGPSSLHGTDCGHVLLTSEEGEITSPSWPNYYKGHFNCLWKIVAPHDKVIVLTTSNISLTQSDSLLMEGNKKDDILSFSAFNPAISYQSDSQLFTIKFTSDQWSTANGFRIHYLITDRNPCVVTSEGVVYDSWQQPFDCNYELVAPMKHQFILLLADEVVKTDSVSARVSYELDSFAFSVADHKQAVVIPSGNAELSISNAWKDMKRSTRISIRVFYLDKEPVVVPFSARGLTLHWPKSETTPYSLFSHAVSIEVEDPRSNYTWSIDRISLHHDDLVQLSMDSSSYNVVGESSSRGSNRSVLMIKQSSNDFTTSIKYSVDCPRLSVDNEDTVVSTSSTHLGVCVSFTCRSRQLFGETELQCLMAGQWSHPPPLCVSVPEASTHCQLPVIEHGYILSSTSSEFRAGASLTFGCKLGYLPMKELSICQYNGLWLPQPTCSVADCPKLALTYRSATFFNTTGTSYGDIAFYSPPDADYAVNSFRICSMDDSGPLWLDTGFDFVEKVCSTYPVAYGHFSRSFYEDGRSTQLICIPGFSQDEKLECSRGEWDKSHLNCSSIAYDSDLCGTHGHVVSQMGAYSCWCDDGYASTNSPQPVCKDNNECLSNVSTCDVDAKCVNTDGSYYCVCPPGKRLWTSGDTTVSYTKYLVANRSCVFTECDISSLNLSDRGWFIRENRSAFSASETVSLFCEMTMVDMGERLTYVEFTATCQEAGWAVPDSPCSETCPNSTDDMIKKEFSRSSPRLFETFYVGCRNSEQRLIGSDRLMCGYDGEYEVLPVCTFEHCSNISLLAKSIGFSYKSSIPNDPFRLGAVLDISPSSCTPSSISCQYDSDLIPRWNTSVVCLHTPSSSPTTTQSPISFEYVNLLQPNISWIHSSDWHVGNRTIFTSQHSSFSYLISSAVLLKSTYVQLYITTSNLDGKLTAATFSSDLTDLPAVGDYTKIGSQTSSGSLHVSLEYLKSHLSVFFQATGPVVISNVILSYTLCSSMTVGNIRFPSAYKFSGSQIVQVVCVNTNLAAYMEANCSLNGWIHSEEDDPCPNVISQHPTSRECDMQDCPNGLCRQDLAAPKGISCDCLPYYVNVVSDNRTVCLPNDAKYTFCSSLGGTKIADHCKCKEGFGNKDHQAFWSCVESTQGCYNCPTGKCALIVYENADGTEEQCVCHTGTSISIPCATSRPTESIPVTPLLSTSSTPTAGCANGKAVAFTPLGTPECECFQNYVGQLCTANTLCLQDDLVTPICQNGGQCLIDEDVANCVCAAPWTGEFCEEAVNFCLSIGCGHGKCLPLFGSSACMCNEGWTGVVCDEQIGCPTANPCQNNAECIAYLEDQVICQCPPGYTGEFCDVFTGVVCDGSVCGPHGTCIARLDGSYSCECDANYRSDGTGNCSVVIEYCSFGPCLNDGECLEWNSLGYNCSCTAGYNGRICDSPVDECEGVDCGHGTCLVVNNQPHCQCEEGYTGETCQTEITHFCSDFVCEHGGTCMEGKSSAYCLCDSQHTGSHCQFSTLACSERDCNSGSCVTTVNNGTYCECWLGYSGDNCRHKMDCSDLDTACENGGTCYLTTVNSTLQPKCTCPSGTSGDRCQTLGQSCMVVKCENGGTCVDDETLNAYCICSEYYTGDTCEIRRSSSFNLMFNGIQSSQRIVTRMLNTSLYREFTLCSWIIYAPSKPTKISDTLPAFVAIITQSDQMVVSINNQGVFLDRNRFIQVTIPTMGWHHVCLRSPEFYSLDRYVWSYYLDGALVANATNTLLPQNNHTLYLVELNPAGKFEGEIGVAQLYTSRLSDKNIAEMAFECTKWTSGHPDLIINWQDFTRVSRSNPGVKSIFPGICETSDCLPGRPSCNSTDKIPPVVLNCPENINEISPSRLKTITWPTSNMFSDNVGIVSVKSNFRPGQAFAWGYYRVVYVGGDAAGNTATCSFNIVVSPSECRSTDDSNIGGTVRKLKVDGIDTQLAAVVSCDDELYPSENPKFFICDAMGQWERSSVSSSSYYAFPACGWTIAPEQNINGSLVVNGTCQQVYDGLQTALSATLDKYCQGNCTDQITIEPKCTGRKKRDVSPQTQTFQYQVYINQTREMLASSVNTTVKSAFPNGTTTNTVQFNCAATHPLQSNYNNLFSCGDCPAGTYWNSTVTKCSSCPPDTYRSSVNQTIDRCIDCPINTTTGGILGVADIRNCYEKCVVGHFYNGTGCEKCPQGTFQAKNGQTTCQGCPLYTSTSIIGATSELDCTYTCDPGREFDPSGVNCYPCDRGSFKVGSIGACVSCPVGLTTVGEGAKFAADCEVANCPPNHRVNPLVTFPVNTSTPFETICLTCEMGTYQPAENKTQCISCPTDGDNDATTCVLSSECSPQLETSCNREESCEAVGSRVGIYSCVAVQIAPTPSSNNAVVWAVIGVAVVIVIVVIAVIVWIYRDKIIFCKALKRTQAPDYYRSPGRHRTHHLVHDAISFTASSKESSLGGDMDNTMRPPIRSLPPPIITSREELAKLERAERMKEVPSTLMNRSDIQFPRFSTNRSVRSLSSDGTPFDHDDDDYFG